MARYEDTLVLKDKVSTALLKMTANLGRFDKAIGKSISGIEKLQKRGENLRKVGQNLQSFGNKLTVGLTLPIIGAGTYAAKMGMEFQDAEMRLQTMLGSAEKGTKMFNDIVKMGAETPFEAKDLLRASTLMLNFGVAEKKVLPYMKMLGDISGGNAERFQSLALAFSQVSANGKLQGQDLLQMVNAGFNPLQIISEKTGKSMAQLRGEMSDGAITIDKVIQAMQWATGEGGRFNNMMVKMSQTASGKLSTMMDNFNMAMANLGKVLLPYVTKGVELLTAAFEKFAALSPKQQKMLLIIAGIAAIIPPLITGLGTLVVSIGSLGVALGFLAANPIILIVAGWTAAFAGLVAGIWAVIKAIQTLVGWFKHLKNMKIPSLKTDLSTDELNKLSGLQASMGEKAFSAKYGKEISKRVSSYRQSNVSTTNNNRTTNNNFYGNMTLTGGRNGLDAIISGGKRVGAY